MRREIGLGVVLVAISYLATRVRETEGSVNLLSFAD